MSEFIDGILDLSFWEVFADLHGGLAMMSLILFGAAISLYFVSDKVQNGVTWLKRVLWLLFADLALLNVAGLSVYVPYRAKGGGPRLELLADESTAWLHEVVFEHKEFLAFAPAVLILTAAVIVTSRKDFQKDAYLKKAVIFSLVAALVFVLVVATEAVLVTKTAPVR